MINFVKKREFVIHFLKICLHFFVHDGFRCLCGVLWYSAHYSLDHFLRNLWETVCWHQLNSCVEPHCCFVHCASVARGCYSLLELRWILPEEPEVKSRNFFRFLFLFPFNCKEMRAFVVAENLARHPFSVCPEFRVS